jgi:hypothetical protein
MPNEQGGRGGAEQVSAFPQVTLPGSISRRRSNRSRIGVQQVAENSRGLSMRISALSMRRLTGRSGPGLSAGLSFGAFRTRLRRSAACRHREASSVEGWKRALAAANGTAAY